MAKSTTIPGSGPQNPENMAEVLEVAVFARQAREKVRAASPELERRKEDEDAVGRRFIVTPKKGEMTAKRWDPDGSNWVSTGEEKTVSEEQPFEATAWAPDGSNGLDIVFYSSPMLKDDEGNVAEPFWKLHISGEELDGIKVEEFEAGGETPVSVYLGRGALSGAAGPAEA